MSQFWPVSNTERLGCRRKERQAGFRFDQRRERDIIQSFCMVHVASERNDNR